MRFRSGLLASVLRHAAGAPLQAGAVALALASSVSGAAFAQQTFADIGGTVARSDGGDVGQVKVEITHVPSGTRILTSVNANGRFNATGLRVGGPYRLRFFGDGLREAVVERDRLQPNEREPVNVTLAARVSSQAEAATDDIIVIAERRTDAFTAADIRVTPQVDRRLQDIVRLDSRAFVDRGEPEDDQGVSILGFNTRFNNLVVDGLSQQDSFGNDFTGLPTRRATVSLDAIETIAVETAPFDVQNSNFQGGQINITTKSGGNEFHGSTFYQRSGGFLSGTRAGTNAAGVPLTVAEEQPENVWGATLSGPILKDRLFFFVSYEEFQEQDLLGSCPIGVPCDNPNENLTLETFESIRQTSIANFGIDPGDFNNFLNTPDGERRFLGKLDWNITDAHRASVTVQRSTSDQVGLSGVGGQATPSGLFANERDTTGVSAQFFSNWTDNFSTQILIGWRDGRNDNTPLLGQTFSSFFINDFVDPLVPGGENVDLSFGVSQFNQQFEVDTRRLQYRFRGQYDLRNHEISFGYDRDGQRIQQNQLSNALGTFQFNGLANFNNATAATVSVTVPTDGDPESLQTDFTLVRNGWFLQDIWRPTPELDVLLGLRYERFGQDEAPELNPFFLAREGIPNTATLDGRDVFQPRFQLNWRALERTTLRGGVGVFAGGVPPVFFAETFITDGVTSTTPSVSNVLNADPNELPAPLQTAIDALGTATLTQAQEGDVAFLDPGFEIPRNLRFQAAIDQEFDVPFLGKNWRFTFEFTHSEILRALQFQDVRPIQQVINGEPVFLPDGTPRFVTPPASFDARPGTSGGQTAGGVFFPFRSPVNNDVLEQDIAITNTSLGFTQVYFVELEKGWNFGAFGNVDFRGSYAFTRSFDVSPSNDTDNIADVFETGAFSNVNDPTAAPSIQAIPHNLIWQFTWNKSFWKNWQAQLFAIGNYRSGRATSLVSDQNTGFISAAITGGTSATPGPFPNAQILQPGFSQRANDRILAPLPTGPNDPNFAFAGGATFAQLQAVIDGLGLQEFQGEILPRNFLRAQDTHQLDLGGSLTIPLPRGRLKLEGAVENFLNLLDRDRGVIRRFAIREDLFDAFFDPTGNNGQGQFVITAIDTGVPLTSVDEQPVAGGGSRWRARLGIRYEF